MLNRHKIRPDTGPSHAQKGFIRADPLIVESCLCRNVPGLPELLDEYPGGGIDNVPGPVRWPENCYIRAAVAVVVGWDGNVANLAPGHHVDPRCTIKPVPLSGRRAQYRDVGRSVAVIIRRDWNVSVLSPGLHKVSVGRFCDIPVMV